MVKKNLCKSVQCGALGTNKHFTENQFKRLATSATENIQLCV